MPTPAKRIVIVGAKTFARRMLVYLTEDAGLEVAGFAVHRSFVQESEVLGLPVVAVEDLREAFDPGSHAVCVAMGFIQVNAARARMCEEIEGMGYELISYTSSAATCWPRSQLGARNVLVLDGTVVAPFARVGDDVVLNGCNVNHDSVIGDHCFIATGATIGGEAEVGPYSFVGLGAIVRNGVTIAPLCVIGAGALIKQDTEEGEVYSARASEPLRLRSWELRDPF